MDLSSPVTALIASFRISGYKMAVGCQDGLVKFLRCPLDGSPSLTSSISLDGPISSVLFLRIKPNVTDLLVTSACGYACYFAGIATKLLVSPVVIVPPEQDSLTSAVACDVDFDGERKYYWAPIAKKCTAISSNLASFSSFGLCVWSTL